MRSSGSRGRGFAIAAQAIALLLGACGPEASSRLRYRMTVEVETPAGLKTGSSVIETTITKGPATGQGSGISYGLKGDAVAVDLGHGQTLFALLSGEQGGLDYHARLFHGALSDGGAVATPPMPRAFETGQWAEERSIARQIKPMLILPAKYYPFLMRFRDIRDPRSVQIVSPGDLSDSFGPGVRLKRITLAVTDAAVTTGIYEKLPSFAKETGFSEWADALEYGDPRLLILSGFHREDGS